MSSVSRSTVALAGAGDLAKYFVEELIAAGIYDIVVLSRAEREWFMERPGVSLHVTDYSHDSILSILNSTSAFVLFSFLHSNDTAHYNVFHENMLSACTASGTCKRLVPSEYGGDIDLFPHLPRFYEPTHAAFRQVLRNQKQIEWTLVNPGWFADYFAPSDKSYLKPIRPVWPMDTEKATVTILGTGDEPIGWTAARDVAKALVRLIEVPRWDEHTYVVGEIGTWNKATEILEKFTGRKFEKTHKSRKTIEENLVRHANDEDPSKGLWPAFMDEWNVTGASAPPIVKVQEQQERFFHGIHFRGIEEVLVDAGRSDKV